MALFKRTPKYGPMVLAIWLIASGGLTLSGLSVPYATPILAGLMIAAGVLILLDR